MILFVAALFISLLLISCMHEIETPRTGSLTVTGDSVGVRTISPLPVEIAVASYRVTGLFSDGETTFTPVETSTLPVTVDNLSEGTWTVTVEGLNAAGNPVSTKSNDVVIVSGQNISATFTLALPEGTGSVSLVIQWPSTVTSFTQIRGTITPTVENKEGFTVATSTAASSEGFDSITQTVEDLPTGSYQFKLEFLDSLDTPVGLSYREALNIYKDMTSSKTYTIPEVIFPIETPVISMDGSYEVSITCATTDATMYYTTDGSEPSIASDEYTTPFTITQNTTVKAFAMREDRLSSAITVEHLEVPAAAPTFSVAADTYESPQEIELSSATTGATIYYTLDGTTPTAESTEYSVAIQVGENTTIKAIAVHPDYAVSVTSSATYLIKVAAPTASLASDSYVGEQSVTLESATTGASIYYTLDGTDPKTSLTRIEYTGEFSIDQSLTLRAIAEKTGWLSSAESSETYVLYVASPTFSVAEGTYASAQSVEISSTTADATMYYTTNGDTPTVSSTLYTGAVDVDQSMTLKAIAVKKGLQNSEIARVDYVIQGESGITVEDLPDYSVSIQLPAGWETGTVITGAGGTVIVSVTPTPAEGAVTYTWYLDGSEMKNNSGTTASTVGMFEFGLAPNEVQLESGPHVLTVEVTEGSMIFSDQKVIVSSTTGTVDTVDNPYEVGNIGPSGGYIFYDDEVGYDFDGNSTIASDEKDLLDGTNDGTVRGDRYLEAAPADVVLEESDYKHIFGYYRTASDGESTLVETATGIGTGKTNTDALVAAMGNTAYTSKESTTTTTTENYAAKLAYDYSLTEGGETYDDWFLPSKDELNLIYENHLEGFSDFYYWSSSENDAYSAWFQYFYSGHQYYCNLYNPYRVRPVRAF